MWTLLWIVLVLGALGVLFLLGRSLFRKAVALARELGDAGERLGAVSAELQALQGDPEPAPEPAVFADPGRLRAERATARRHGARGARGGPAQGRSRGNPR